MKQKDITRFWSKVKKTDGCWLWTGRPHRHDGWGYGRFGVMTPGGQKFFGAHRFAYIVTCGDIPEGLIVRHSCDNPMCVRPDHLILGTHEENVQDQVERGRHVKGESVGTARFSSEDVRSIRALYESGAAHQAKIAQMYGVSRRTINRIVRYQSRIEG